MNFFDWVAQVQRIAISRNLILTTTYTRSPFGSQWASFNWRAMNGSRYGSSGAGEEFIGLTTPEQFTWDWYSTEPNVPPPPVEPAVPANPWERRGRFVPRVPAMAVSDALRALFGVS
jgi:hypothetical protein